MEEALTARLLASAALTALVGNRITWDERPQGSALPSVTLTLIDGGPEYSDEGPAGLSSTRVQVDCWAATKADVGGSLLAKRVARAVIDALPVTFGSLGVSFDGVFLDSARDFPPEVEAGGNLKIYRRSLDFEIWHSA